MECSPVTLTCLLASTIKGRRGSGASSSCKCCLAMGKSCGWEASTTNTSIRALGRYIRQYGRRCSRPPTGKHKSHTDLMSNTRPGPGSDPTPRFWLTFQELHVDVILVDGDGVEALAGLDILLQAAGGPVMQQAGFPSSIQTQNQDLGPRRVQGSGLKHRQSET